MIISPYDKGAISEFSLLAFRSCTRMALGLYELSVVVMDNTGGGKGFAFAAGVLNRLLLREGGFGGFHLVLVDTRGGGTASWSFAAELLGRVGPIQGEGQGDVNDATQ